jgi:flagellar motor switch protein FliN/FliY
MNTSLDDDIQTLQPVELTPLQSLASEAAISPAVRLAALAGVQAQVRVVAGHATTTVGDILNLKEGSVFKLDTELNAPFDVVVNDTVIARGELVAVGDHFGVCITQVQTAHTSNHAANQTANSR